MVLAPILALRSGRYRASTMQKPIISRCWSNTDRRNSGHRSSAHCSGQSSTTLSSLTTLHGRAFANRPRVLGARINAGPRDIQRPVGAPPRCTGRISSNARHYRDPLCRGVGRVGSSNEVFCEGADPPVRRREREKKKERSAGERSAKKIVRLCRELWSSIKPFEEL